MAIGDDFDPLTVPKVLSQQVRRTDNDGYPKQALIDYEQALQSWMQRNTASTNERLSEVSDSVDGAYAAITEEAETRATEDEALASLITSLTATVGSNTAAITAEATARSTFDTAIASTVTTVDATANSALTGANNATASGQVFLAAMSAPSGAAAAYGWHLTAGSSYAGMQAIALSGGGSAIGFTASQFYFTDSGTAQQVLTYNGSAFVFGVPIVIQSGTSGARTVITNEVIEVYDASNVLRVRLGIW